MNYRLTAVLTALLGLGLACGTAPGEATVDVEECADGADVDETTLIVWELEDSVHEMITCGSLTFQLIFALVDTAQTLLTEPSSLPSAFSYADGAYTTTGEGVSMDLVFRYGPDTPGGQAGDDIAHNLFVLDSYLVGADAVKDGEVVVVTFSEPGPLAPMLGRGASPQSPLTLTETDLALLSSNLSSVKIKAQIHVDDEVVTSVITYDIDNPAVFVLDALLGLQMNMELVSAASGARADLGQQLQSTTWDIAYGEVTGTLEGTIEADVTGGPFDFQVRYDYSAISSEPAIDITCL